MEAMTFLCNQRGYVMTILLQWQIQGRGSRGGDWEPPPPPTYLKVWICHCAVLLQFCAEVITWYLWPDTKCFCTVLEKISNKFHQGTLTIIIFWWFLKAWPNFQFSPSPSLPSFATDNRIHFQCLNIVLTLLSPDSDQDQISLSNIHTLSRDKLWELIKWSLKRKCLDLLPNSLKLFFNEIYRDQFGEFVCG